MSLVVETFGGATYEGIGDAERRVVPKFSDDIQLSEDVYNIIKRAPYSMDDRNELIVTRRHKTSTSDFGENEETEETEETQNEETEPIDIAAIETKSSKQHGIMSPDDIREKSPIERMLAERDMKLNQEYEDINDTKDGGVDKKDNANIDNLLFKIDDTVVDLIEGGNDDSVFGDYFEISSN